MNDLYQTPEGRVVRAHTLLWNHQLDTAEDIRLPHEYILLAWTSAGHDFKSLKAIIQTGSAPLDELKDSTRGSLGKLKYTAYTFKTEHGPDQLQRRLIWGVDWFRDHNLPLSGDEIELQRYIEQFRKL